MPKSQGLCQEGLIQSIYCCDQGGPCYGAYDRIFFAPETLGILQTKMKTLNSPRDVLAGSAVQPYEVTLSVWHVA